MTHSTLVPVSEDNLEALLDLTQELVALSSYSITFDRDWTRAIARGGMRASHMFGRMARLDNGTYVGMIIGSATPMMLTPQRIGVEETIYVREGTPFRASIAKQLLTALEVWAFGEMQVAFLRAGETSEICPKAVDAFFRGCGFKRAGSIYKKERV